MRRCDACHIDYSGDLTRCPLCGTTLVGAPEPSPFPRIVFQQKSKKAQKILGAVSLTLFAAIVIVCLVRALSPLVTICTLIALVVNYAFVRNIIAHSPDFLRMIERYFLVIMAMGLLFYVATGYPFISEYIIPALSLVALVFDGVILAIFRRDFVSDYAKYLLSDVVLSVVPAALALFGAPVIPQLVIICIMTALLMIIALMVSARKQVHDEAHKLFDA